MIVLLHGVGGRASMWDPVVAALQTRGQSARALDLPGYGANAFLPDPYDFKALSHWLAGKLQKLREEFGPASPIVLVGQSFGGMIALDYAARAAGDMSLPPLNKLVLMNTSPAFGKPGGDWQQKFIESRLAPLRAGKSMREVGMAVAPGMLGTAAPADCAAQAIEMMAAVSPITYERAVRCLSVFDRRADLARLALPVLCLAGSDDSTAPAEVMRKMSGFIPGASYAVVAAAGHLLPMEQPQATAQAICEFLKDKEQ